MGSDHIHQSEYREFWPLGEVKFVKIYQDAGGGIWLFLSRRANYHYGMPGVVIEDRPDCLAVKPRIADLDERINIDPKPGDLIPENEDSWAERNHLDWEIFSAEQGISQIVDEETSYIDVVKLPVLPQKEVKVVSD